MTIIKPGAIRLAIAPYLLIKFCIFVVMIVFMINFLYEQIVKPNAIGFCWARQKSLTREEIRNEVIEQLIEAKYRVGGIYPSVLPIYYTRKSLTENDIQELISLSVGYGYSDVLTRLGLIEYNRNSLNGSSFSIFMKGGDSDDFEITTSDCCSGSISENKINRSYEFTVNGFLFELSSNYGLSRENEKTILSSLYPTKMVYEIDSCATIKKEISYQDPKISINLNRAYRK